MPGLTGIGKGANWFFLFATSFSNASSGLQAFVTSRHPRQNSAYGFAWTDMAEDWDAKQLPPCFAGQAQHLTVQDNLPGRRIAESLGGVVTGENVTPKYASLRYSIPRRPPAVHRDLILLV
ncbi:conserved hypothetical protein [Ricinus communis]|uniref:Uncharacterized protein n=1 Tax=Ricinus communis TaxID=3988 RepID=B9TCK0_RICCO|nr:conserved hypothetical protein [Ricinus communis]